MKIIIRRAKREDLEAINTLTEAMHRYLANLYELDLSTEELEEEYYGEEELENLYVAEEEGGNVIGYMSFSLGRDEWAGPHYELEHIVVNKDYRGLGIGRRLFTILLEKAMREGVNITTGTLARNKEALKFYEGLGFKPLYIGLILDLQRRILR